MIKKLIDLLLFEHRMALSHALRSGITRNIDSEFRRTIRTFIFMSPACFLVGIIVDVARRSRELPTASILLTSLLVAITCSLCVVAHRVYVRRRFVRIIRATWPNSRPPICYACNYDLRGSPGPTCPECGEKIPTLADLGMADEGERPSRKDNDTR